MAHGIADIRSAIAAVLTGHYSSLGWTVNKYLSSTINPPCMDLEIGPIDYDQAMARGDDAIHVTVRAYVQWGDSDVGQAALDPVIDLISTDSLKTVLEADKTLGGTVDAVHVLSVSNPQVIAVQGGSDLPAVEFAVEVYPNG